MAEDNNKPLVLIVDDDEDMLVLLQVKLAAEGFNPVSSPNAEKLMQLIHEKRPDIILLDIHMQGTDGGATCQELKSDPGTSSIPVIMFSSTEKIEEVSKQCGADGFMVKPLDSDKLRKTIHQIVDQAGSTPS